MIDIDPISFYFSLKIEKNCIKRILKLFQPAYIDKIPAKYHLNQAKLWNVTIKKRILLPNKRPKASQVKREQYQGITRFLMFCMVETRPEIAFPISVISRFAKNLSRQYIEAVKKIMRYLKATTLVEITYGRKEDEEEDLTIKRYFDFN